MAINNNDNQKKQKVYEIIICYSCDWDCSYCAVDTHKNNISFEDVKIKLEYIEKNSKVILSGGEPGTMTKQNIIYIIEYLNNKKCELYMNTNGLFIKNYPDLTQYFDTIYFHCTQDMEPIRNYNTINKYENIVYVIVLCDLNFHKLDNFLKLYPDLVFDMIPSTMPYKVNNEILSKHNVIKLKTKYFKFMTDKSKKNIVFGREYYKTTIYI